MNKTGSTTEASVKLHRVAKDHPYTRGTFIRDLKKVSAKTKPDPKRAS